MEKVVKNICDCVVLSLWLVKKEWNTNCILVVTWDSHSSFLLQQLLTNITVNNKLVLQKTRSSKGIIVTSLCVTPIRPHLNCVPILYGQRLLLCDVLKIDRICVADDRFQLSRPGDFDVTLTSYIHCLFHVQFVFHTSLNNWRDNTTKLHLYFDDLFQPSSMLLVSVLLTIFSSPVQSSIC